MRVAACEKGLAQTFHIYFCETKLMWKSGGTSLRRCLNGYLLALSFPNKCSTKSMHLQYSISILLTAVKLCPKDELYLTKS